MAHNLIVRVSGGVRKLYKPDSGLSKICSVCIDRALGLRGAFEEIVRHQVSNIKSRILLIIFTRKNYRNFSICKRSDRYKIIFW